MPYADPEDKFEYSREYYQNNKDKMKQTTKAWKEANPDRVAAYAEQKKADKRERARRRLNIARGRANNVCKWCGISELRSKLLFHHRNGEVKLGNIATMAYNSTDHAFWEEVAKCDLICYKCHSNRHASS